MGMGDAFVALADDGQGFFYNPAALGRQEEAVFDLGFDLAASEKIPGFVRDISALSSQSGSNSEKFTAYANFLEARYGSYFQARLSPLSMFWVRPRWGFGLIPLDFTAEFSVLSQAVPALNLRAFGDTTLALGYGDEIKGSHHQITWGVTGKFINRLYYANQFNALDLVVDNNLFKNENAQEGYSVDADLGLLFTPHLGDTMPWLVPYRPTLGLVVRNLLDYKFARSLRLVNKTDSNTPPEPMNRVVDIGSKFELPGSWGLPGRLMVDARDLGHPNVNVRKASHLGVEFDWALANWWKGQVRAGFNQGFWTAGASLLFTTLRLEFASYAEDVGSFSSPKESRSYSARLSFSF